MRTLSYVKVIMFFLITVGLASCGDKYYDDEYLKNSDEKLCGKVWVEDYVLDNGELCVHKLKFARNGSGEEIHTYQRPNGNNGWLPVYETNSKVFTWEWIDNMEAIFMRTGAGEDAYFEGVWVREYYLIGKLRGYESTFYSE